MVIILIYHKLCAKNNPCSLSRHGDFSFFTLNMKRGGGVKSKYCQSDLLNHQRYNIPYELNQKYCGGGEQASPV